MKLVAETCGKISCRNSAIIQVFVSGYLYKVLGCLKAERHGATLPRNLGVQRLPCNLCTSNHDAQRLHGNRCTPRLRGKVAPCLSAFRETQCLNIILPLKNTKSSINFVPVNIFTTKSYSVFPNYLKTARTIQILKSTNFKDPSNYRPTASLSYMSKIFAN